MSALPTEPEFEFTSGLHVAPAPGAGDLVEWGAAGLPKPGETESGDQFVVIGEAQRVLIALGDGLGHGPEAALAGKLAMQTITQHAAESLEQIVAHCHRALTGTRGVALTLARVNGRGHLRWLAVGNVEGLLVHSPFGAPRKPDRVVQRSGIVGYQMPTVQTGELDIAFGDTLILATDGIQSDSLRGISFARPPGVLAEHILTQYRLGTDDALVVAARYLGGQS
jgi:phosphoserine phosphatase RsbX